MRATGKRTCICRQTWLSRTIGRGQSPARSGSPRRVVGGRGQRETKGEAKPSIYTVEEEEEEGEETVTDY